MKNDNTPCMNCKDRTEECHGKCLKYIDYVQSHNKKKQILYENKRKQDMIESYFCNAIRHSIELRTKHG